MSGADKPLISMIIPIYQVESWLPECIDSVLAQDYPNLEVILVDDASTDGSRFIARAYADQNARVTLLTHAVNRGLGPARNTGTVAASGDFVFYLDSDDFLTTPTAISSLVVAARTHACTVVVGSCEALLPDGSRQEFDRRYDRDLGGMPGEIMRGEAAYWATWGRPDGTWLPIRASGILIERSFLIRTGLNFPPGEHEDLCFTPFLFHQSDGVYYEQEIVLTYRRREQSLSNLPWTAARIRRYAALWEHIRANLDRFDLHAATGDTAIKFVESMTYKLRANGTDDACDDDIVTAVSAILRDVDRIADPPLFRYAMDLMREVLTPFFPTMAMSQAFHRLFPREALIMYYRTRLNDAGMADLFPETAADGPWAPDVLVLCDFALRERAARNAAVSDSAISANAAAAAAATREMMWETRLQAAETRAKQAQIHHAALLSSHSWRITAPLRELARLARGGTVRRNS